MIRLAHIVNPYKAPEGSDAAIEQPIVYESMRRAKKEANGTVEVQLLATCYEEDQDVIPQGFESLHDLTQSILDKGSFTKQRKLPLIKEILTRLYEGTDAEYLVYTNADIILMPYFYKTVASYLEQGHDALIINRRRIPKSYNSPEQLDQIYAETGMSHPGFDCFVFHRSLFPKFVLEDICIGVPFIGVTLAHNIFAHARNYLLLDDVHLTKHLGMEVMPQHEPDYYRYNRGQFEKVYTQLKPLLKDQNYPYYDQPWPIKVLKRALNPSVFIGTSVDLEVKGFGNKMRYYLNNIRFQLLNRN